jgi:NTE family protein
VGCETTILVGASMRSALVLGGGGVAGIAWEIGVLCALYRNGVDVGAADRIIGTSAGAVVGALVAAGIDLEAAANEQRVDSPGMAATVDPDAAARALEVLSDTGLTPSQRRVRLCAVALSAHTGDEEALVAQYAQLLPIDKWPDRNLLITAVDVNSGRFVLFGRYSGVSLVRAIAASCAVPCVYPAISVAGGRFIDGGVRSKRASDSLTSGYVRICREVVAPGRG